MTWYSCLTVNQIDMLWMQGWRRGKEKAVICNIYPGTLVNGVVAGRIPKHLPYSTKISCELDDYYLHDYVTWITRGFPSGLDGKAYAWNARDLGSIPGSGRRKWQPTPVFLPGKFHGRRNLVGYTVHGVAKCRTWLSNFTFFLSLCYLAKGDCLNWLDLITRALKNRGKTQRFET